RSEGSAVLARMPNVKLSCVAFLEPRHSLESSRPVQTPCGMQAHNESARSSPVEHYAFRPNCNRGQKPRSHLNLLTLGRLSTDASRRCGESGEKEKGRRECTGPLGQISPSSEASGHQTNHPQTRCPERLTALHPHRDGATAEIGIRKLRRHLRDPAEHLHGLD